MKRFPSFQQAEPVPESSSVDLQETSTFIDKNHKEHPNPLTHSIHSSWVIFWFDAHRMADELLSTLLPSQFGISVQNCRFTLHLWPFPGVPISSSSLGKHGLRFAQLQETLQQGWSKPGGHSTICQRFFSWKNGAKNPGEHGDFTMKKRTFLQKRGWFMERPKHETSRMEV